MTPGYTIYSSGDYALTVELGNEINLQIHQRVMALYTHIKQAEINSIKDIIPAYTSVTVIYDLMQVKKVATVSAYHYIYDAIKILADTCNWDFTLTPRHIKIPVCYDVSLAPDIERMALEKQLTIDEIIALHTADTYRVYMIGFLPGFAYMGVTGERISTPRLAKPRMQVAAGSVGIAGNQTGIYPSDSPGGWNIIGQTPLKMFDIKKDDPCFLQPGDKVEFVSISLQQFNQLKQP